MDEKRRAARWRKRRIIYNNDGDDALEARTGVEHDHDVAEALMTRKTGELTDDFLNARSTPLAGSQVDSNWYCSCMAGLTFSHNTKLGGFVGKGIPQELVDKYGRDSLQVQVDFSHENGMEAFWSLRMNDVHDSFPMGSRRWTYGLAPFKRDHPEYMMGRPEDWEKYPDSPRHVWSALDFSFSEVRDHIFSLIEEVAQNYDVDGIGMELFKYFPYFRETLDCLPVELQHMDLMTDLMRRIRKMADEVGEARGRPLLLAVHTPSSVEDARFVGLDLEKWLEEDLIDMLIPGLNESAMTYSFAEIVDVGHKYDVPVYPCIHWSFWQHWSYLELGADKHRTYTSWIKSLYGGHPKDRGKPSYILEINSWQGAGAVWRGAAMNLFNDGADGIYIFNPALWQESEAKHKTWQQIGDPATMTNKSRIYGVDRFEAESNLEGSRSLSNPHDGEARIEIEEGESANLHFNVGEDLKQANVSELRFGIHFWNLNSNDEIVVNLNGQLIDHLMPESHTRVSSEEQWLESELTSSQVKKGNNEVEILLKSRSESLEKTIVLDAVQLHVSP